MQNTYYNTPTNKRDNISHTSIKNKHIYSQTNVTNTSSFKIPIHALINQAYIRYLGTVNCTPCVTILAFGISCFGGV